MARPKTEFMRLLSLLEEAGDTDDCIDWPGSADRSGYGWCTNGKEKRAHRVSYIHATGKELRPGEQVLHRCDRPCCINPKHLWLGTIQENISDMDAKGRRAKHSLPRLRGQQHGRAKLTDEDIPLIRQLTGSGLSARAIGKKFSVAQSTIGDIARGVTWAHVKR